MRVGMREEKNTKKMGKCNSIAPPFCLPSIKVKTFTVIFNLSTSLLVDPTIK